MFKLYDNVIIKESKKAGTIVEIDDNGGKNVPIYLVELHDKPDNAEISDVIKWLEYSEIEEIG